MVDFTKETPVSVKEVAERFKVTPKTVYVWAKGLKGRKLETAKLGGQVYTTNEALQRFSVSSESVESEVAQLGNQFRKDEAEMKRRHEEAIKALRERHGI